MSSNSYYRNRRWKKLWMCRILGFDPLTANDTISFLSQVCDAQTQFSRNLKLPAFAGSRGLDLTKSLTDSQETFHKLVNHMRALSYNLLDVKVTSWHDDFHDFKEGTTDLEVILPNHSHDKSQSAGFGLDDRHYCKSYETSWALHPLLFMSTLRSLKLISYI